VRKRGLKPRANCMRHMQMYARGTCATLLRTCALRYINPRDFYGACLGISGVRTSREDGRCYISVGVKRGHRRKFVNTYTTAFSPLPPRAERATRTAQGLSSLDVGSANLLAPLLLYPSNLFRFSRESRYETRIPNGRNEFQHPRSCIHRLGSGLYFSSGTLSRPTLPSHLTGLPTPPLSKGAHCANS